MADKAEKLWPAWTDPLGSVYAPGDLVAYASLAGRSAILKFGEVVRINRVNSKGKEIFRRKGTRGADGLWTYQTIPSCTITVRPIDTDFNIVKRREAKRVKGKGWEYEKDENGGYVYEEKLARLITIQLPGNVLAIKTTPDDVDGIVERLVALQNDLEGGGNDE